MMTKSYPLNRLQQSWRGRTIFRLKPLTGKALEKARIAAQKYQQAPAKTLQKDGFRLSSDEPSSDLPSALTSNPSSSSKAPPARPIVSDPGVSSRGTEKRIDRQHIVTSKEGEKLIMNKLRSLREFDLDMKDLIVRLFYTKDPQTNQTRTTDHWVQTPGYWIRIFHTERDDLIDPDNCPSPLSSADAIAFGDTLNAERNTCTLECSDPQQNGIEIDDFWCNYTDQAGNPKTPEENPGRELPYRWIGFSDPTGQPSVHLREYGRKPTKKKHMPAAEQGHQAECLGPRVTDRTIQGPAATATYGPCKLRPQSLQARLSIVMTCDVRTRREVFQDVKTKIGLISVLLLPFGWNAIHSSNFPATQTAFSRWLPQQDWKGDVGRDVSKYRTARATSLFLSTHPTTPYLYNGWRSAVGMLC